MGILSFSDAKAKANYFVTSKATSFRAAEIGLLEGLEYHASNINNYNRRLEDLTRLTEDDELWASPFIDFNFKEVQRLVDCVHFEVEDLLQFRDARVDPSLWSERAYEKYLSVGKEI